MRTRREAGAKTFSVMNERTRIHFAFPSLSWWILVHGCSEWIFLSVRYVLSWRFSRIALLLKRLQVGSKSDSNTNWLIFEILLGYALFRRCIISVDWKLQHLLKFVSFWRRQLIPIVCLKVFSCVLWIFPYFQPYDFVISIDDFNHAIYFVFWCLSVFQIFFMKVALN